VSRRTARSGEVSDLAELERRLGHTFANADLARQALTHRSFGTPHNERLEFLGDAVLQIIVTEHLFRTFPDEPEGRLTAWRGNLVNATSLAKIGEHLGLNDLLLLGRGEARDDGKARMHRTADAVEAILGALYLDQGINACHKVVDALLLANLRQIIAEGGDVKGKLQEFAHMRFKLTPQYQVVETTGPVHAPRFKMAVFLQEQRIAEGEGPSKKEAEVAAATRAFQSRNAWQTRIPVPR